MYARRRLGVLAALAAIVTAGIAGNSFLTRPGTAADGSEGFLAFGDEANGTTFAVGLDAAGERRGSFQFAVAGVGLFWPDTPASIETKSDSSVIVRYDGPGQLDRAAALDLVFGFHQRSGEREPVPIRLEAQVNPDRITASAELWSGGVGYKLTDRRALPDAGEDLAAILAALRAEDWPGLYRRTYSGARAQMSEADFVAAISAAYAARGRVLDAQLVSGPTYGDGRAGFDTASATVSVTLSENGTPRTYRAQASLIWEADHWALLSLDLAD